MKLRRSHVWGFLLLTLNAAYIWSFADPLIFYMGNVLLHMLLGISLVFVALRGALKQRQDSPNPLGFVWRSYVLSLSALVFLPVVVISYNHFRPDPRDRIHNPMTARASMEEEGDGSSSPFYPSSARTERFAGPWVWMLQIMMARGLPAW